MNSVDEAKRKKNPQGQAAKTRARPAELLDIIERKGREVAEAVAALRHFRQSRALDWVVDQYQVSEDKSSGICSDPNRLDDREYIVRLVV